MSKRRQKREYKRLEQVDHIKHRPDTFVGSIDELEQEKIFVADLESEDPTLKFKERTLLSDALIRIFVEILSNAIDNIHRSIEDEVEMKKIKININRETNEISIWNDGSSIPIEIHKEENKYIPHLIFGILQTSSNYDDSQERYTSGRNGFGAKLTNIFSKKFKVEIVDIDENDECTYYKQTWFNNMKECKKPKIVKVKPTTPFTKITWRADFDVFPGSGYNNRTLAMYYRLIYDASMIAGSHKISIYLNDKKLPIKSLKDYAKLFGNCEEIIEINTDNSKIVITPSNVGFQNMAFTNGVFNSKGGVHVNVWGSCIFKPLLAKINKKGKPQLVIKDIQQFFRIFIKCDLVNPKFKTQSKDYLASPTPEAKIDNKVIKALMKWSFIDKVNEIIQGKELITLKRKEKKSKGFKAIPGYDPANNSGSKDSSKCTLIFTEGLSAKTYAVRGIEKGVDGLKGRDWFGVFPLRGKLLNVRNASTNDIAKNNEITNTINALGLRYGVDYSKDSNYNKLNYGKICILCDADVDGIHIQGLLINVFHTLFPSLLEREESFIISMETPIVRVFKGSNTLIFYTEKEFKDFLKITENHKYQRKYHKGLGTSSNKEVLDTFGEKLIKYKKDEHTDDKMNMLFYNKNSNRRKRWLESHDPDAQISTSINGSKHIDMTYTKFIDERMIDFSLDDCGRSIPHVLDGLKESQRKILFSVFLKNLNYKSKTLKVAQLAGYVAEKSAYHHGEQCLHDTIIKLANDIIGLNNIPLLYRDGQFATRLSGKDAAAGRYIFTKLDKLTRLLFPPSDDHLLPLNEEDGEKIEPEYYLPIIPMILCNGCLAGIGTGWSCSIPCFNPEDLVRVCNDWMDDNVNEEEELVPWYRNFKGKIKKDKKNKYKYISSGVISRSKGKVIISELPIGVWTDKYKEFLEKLLEDKMIKSMKNYSTPQEVKFVISEHSNGMKCNKENMKLSSSLSTSNMVLFLPGNKIHKFQSVKEIIEVFCKHRLELYEKRKVYLISQTQNSNEIAMNKKRFLEYVMDDKIEVYRKSEEFIVKQLADLEFLKKGKNTNYEYLLSMDMRSFTKERIEKLNSEIEKLERLLDTFQNTTPTQMWKKELKEFTTEYFKWRKNN